VTLPTTAAPAKILVADDDRTLLEALTMILEDKGYDVVAVPDGQGLLQLIEKEEPDLLMLDIMMPKVDGLQLLQEVRSDERFRDLPVLMISSMAPEEATVRSLGLGASDFIAKPFRVRELTARVEAQLRQGEALQSARTEARRRAEEAAIRAEMVDILHEVTDALAPEEIYHVLTRRVANVLNVSRCSMVLAKRGDTFGRVVVAAESPMLRNLEVKLDKYPEINMALRANRPVLVADVQTDPLYAEVRERWAREGVEVATHSVIAVPFGLREEQSGVFFLRNMDEAPTLAPQDMEFAANVVRTAVSAIERAYALQTAQSDKERYQWLAATDPLTGCLNRRALMEKLEDELDRMRRYELAVSVLMIDLDRFKEVNDTRGHLAGDRVLQQLGEMLRQEVRSVDVVARYGGEEFVITLPETSLPGAMVFAERIRERIAAHDFADSSEALKATVSIGVASISPGDAVDPDGVIALADEALYRAKHEGRNLVRS
jgi:two-component system cell cycle response regulator